MIAVRASTRRFGDRRSDSGNQPALLQHRFHHLVHRVIGQRLRHFVQLRGGDPKKLKEATAKLDEVTKPLADHAMDKAMEAMLKKRGLIS